MCGSRHQRRQLGADIGSGSGVAGGGARLAGRAHQPTAVRFPSLSCLECPSGGSALRIPAACEKTTPPPPTMHPSPPRLCPTQSAQSPPLSALSPLLLTPLRSDYPRLVSLVGTLLGCSSNPPPCCQCFSPITPVNILVGQISLFTRGGSFSLHSLSVSFLFLLIVVLFYRVLALSLSIYLSICPSVTSSHLWSLVSEQVSRHNTVVPREEISHHTRERAIIPAT